MTQFARQWNTRVARWIGVGVLAAALAVAGVAYESGHSVAAAGPAPGPTASPIDDNSVNALLALDKAMETVASRVTPAVVNVNVTSRVKGNAQIMGEDGE